MTDSQFTCKCFKTLHVEVSVFIITVCMTIITVGKHFVVEYALPSEEEVRSGWYIDFSILELSKYS